MTQKVGVISGTNQIKDYMFMKGISSFLNGGYINGLDVWTNTVGAGKALIPVEKTDGTTFLLYYENETNYTIDTSGTKKVYVEVDQTQLDNGAINTDGTGVAQITTGPSYPSKNFIPLASITSGVITLERELIDVKSFFDYKDDVTVTTQTNTFNAANKLVQLDSSGKYPALDGSQITDVQGTPRFFGDGSDGDLIITSGSTSLTTGTVWNYSSISISAGASLIPSFNLNYPYLRIKCKGVCTIDGKIDLAEIGTALIPEHRIYLPTETELYITRGQGGTGGNGGKGGGAGSYDGGPGGTTADGIGGGGGGGAGYDTNGSYDGGDGGNAGYPGGLGGNGNDTGGGHGQNGGVSAGGGGGGRFDTGYCGDGGNAYSNDGQDALGGGSYGMLGGGGGAGGMYGQDGLSLILYVQEFAGSGEIDTSGGNGGDGGDGGNGYRVGTTGGGAGGGGGGGAGGGGSSGAILLLGLLNTFGGTITQNYGTGGSGGTHGNDILGYTTASVNGGSGGNATGGELINSKIKDIL